MTIDKQSYGQFFYITMKYFEKNCPLREVILTNVRPTSADGDGCISRLFPVRGVPVAPEVDLILFVAAHGVHYGGFGLLGATLADLDFLRLKH